MSHQLVGDHKIDVLICIDEGGSMDVVFGSSKGFLKGSPQKTNRKVTEARNRGKTEVCH